MLIAAGAAVFTALGHRIFLHPDDVVAEIPAVITQGKRQHPRDADEVLWLTALDLVIERNRLTGSALGIFHIQVIALISLSGVGIGDIEPERAIRDAERA